MKLNETRPYFESSADMEEQFFSIEDTGMIFDILRNKMYSNPILAICREITSNARDAHREVGKPEVPIEIHLPNNLEPDYKIKDFGPGISPDRMLNIFIKYTASTKRNDNVQTGGFGLGAKTPFSYSDSFAITTIHDGIQYSYSCGIDSTKVGKLALLDKRPTDAVNSTEISIPIKPQDFHFFNQWTEQACRHWDVKPIIKGGIIQWTTFNKILEGTNWAIATSNNYERHAKLVIDSIEYPLELDTLRKYADPKLIDSARGHFIMYFGVGELSLSASRENIYLDKTTQDKIKQRLDDITKEIRGRVTTKIDAFPNLWAANVYYRKELLGAFSNLEFLKKLTWKGYELHNGYISVKCNAYTFTKGKNYSYTGKDPDKITRSMNASIYFEEDIELYLNDLPLKEPTPRHVKKAFEDDPKLKKIQVICPNDIQSEADLNKQINLDQMQPKRLSSITKASGRNYTASASRLLVFKFDPTPNAFRQVSYDSMEEDLTDKVLCILQRDPGDGTRSVLLKNKKILPASALKSLLILNPKISLYGIDQTTEQTRIDEEFEDFQDIESFLEEKIIDNKSMNYVEIKFSQLHRYSVDENMTRLSDQLVPLIKDNKSDFLIRLNLHKKIKELSNIDEALVKIYESIKGEIDKKQISKFLSDNPEWNIEEGNAVYHKKYPILGMISTYSMHQVIQHMAHYINMVDKF